MSAPDLVLPKTAIYVLSPIAFRERALPLIQWLKDHIPAGHPTVSWQIIDGFNGQATDYSQHEMVAHDPWMYWPMTSGEVACDLSHRAGLRAFVEQDQATLGLLLEDDAQVPDHLIELIEDIHGLDLDWDLFKLYNEFWKHKPYLTAGWVGSRRYRVHYPRNSFLSAAAILYNRRGAERALDVLHVIRKPIDFQLGENHLRVFCLDPDPVRPRGEASLIDQVSVRRRGGHEITKRYFSHSWAHFKVRILRRFRYWKQYREVKRQLARAFPPGTASDVS